MLRISAVPTEELISIIYLLATPWPQSPVHLQGTAELYMQTEVVPSVSLNDPGAAVWHPEWFAGRYDEAGCSAGSHGTHQEESQQALGSAAATGWWEVGR